MNPYQNYQSPQQPQQSSNPYLHFGGNQQQQPQQQQNPYVHSYGGGNQQQQQYGSGQYSGGGYSNQNQQNPYGGQYAASSSYGQNAPSNVGTSPSSLPGLGNLGYASAMSPQYNYSSGYQQAPSNSMGGAPIPGSWEALRQQQSQFVTKQNFFDSSSRSGNYGRRRDSDRDRDRDRGRRNDREGGRRDRRGEERRRSPDHSRSSGFSSRRDQTREEKGSSAGFGDNYRHYIFHKVSQMPVTYVKRKFADLKSRYPKMRVSSDFITSTMSWIENGLVPITYDPTGKKNNQDKIEQVSDAKENVRKAQEREPIPLCCLPDDSIEVIFDNQSKKFIAEPNESGTSDSGKDVASLHEGVKYNVKLMLPLASSLKTQFAPFYDIFDQLSNPNIPNPNLDTKAKVISAIENAENMLFSKNSSGTPDQPNTFAASNHMTKQFRFIVAKKDSSGILPISGSWNKHKDAGNPTEDATLIKTAIRVGNEFLGLDLSCCDKWYKMLEVNYDRPEEEISSSSSDQSTTSSTKVSPKYKEKSVFLIPNWWEYYSTSALVSGKFKKLSDVWEERKKTIEQVIDNMMADEKKSTTNPASSTSLPGLNPNAKDEAQKRELLDAFNSELGDGIENYLKDPRIFITTPKNKLKTGVRILPMSLTSLLEYSENEKSEKTFEVSLFAEVFTEALQYHFGKILFEECSKRWKLSTSASPAKENEKKRAFEEETDKTNEETENDLQPPAKKQKITTNEGNIMEHIPRKTVEKEEKEEKNENDAKEVKESTKKIEINFMVLEAFRYFDKNACNFIYCDDLVRVIHNLALDLTHRQVKDMVYGITGHEKRLRYLDFCINEI